VSLLPIPGRTLAAALLAAAAAGTASASPRAAGPIVTVVRHGGLCASGSECRTVLRIDDRRVSGEGYESRRLAPGERSALLRAIAGLDLAYLRRHPFRGTCPTAYDGSESVYRFRGFPHALPSCTYDLHAVAAVRLAERLLGSLEPA